MPRLLLALQLWFCMFMGLVACDKGNFKAPMALATGYLFPGAATLMSNEDGTYVLAWPLPPTEGTQFRIYKRTAPELFDFSKPIAQTEKQIYVSEDLRFAPKTCFVVRFTIAGYEGDKNTNEVCTKEFDFQFEGLDEITRDERNIWTLSWKTAPFKRVSYRVYEVDPNGSLNPTAVREVTETLTRLGPFPVGVVKCFVVRLLIGGKSEGDTNTKMKCTDSNRIGRFVGIERASSESTGVVQLNWTAADNESVVGYLLYRGTTFQDVVTKVELRQTSSVRVQNLTPGSTQTFGVRALSSDGSEDPNTRTISVEVKDLRPLLFAGLADATVSGKGEVLLKWSPIETAQEYRVYSASGANESRPVPNFAKPLLVISDISKAEVRVQNLGDEMEHSFLIRAVSRFGVEEQNTSSKFVKMPDQGAPIFLGLKMATVEAGKVKLIWEPATGYIKQYKIFRTKGSASSLDFSQTILPIEPGTSTSSIIGGFQANQFYTFAVRAEDGSQQDSNTVTRTVLIGQQSLPVFSGYLGASALGERSVRISFNVTNDANVLQYRVRSRVSGTTNWITSDVVPQDLARSVVNWTIGSEDIISPLRAKTEYEIFVTVVDIWGNESLNTVTYRISTLDLTPPLFNGVETVEQTPGSSDLKLNWPLRKTTDIDKYVVYWSSEPMDGSKLFASSALPSGVQRTVPLDGASTSYTVKNVARGLTYYFIVHALDAMSNEENNTVQVSSVVLNSFPSLLVDVPSIRTPEREPGVIVNLTATDTNQSDALTLSLKSSTCPVDMNQPQLTVSPQAGGTRKAQVTWTPSQDFIQPGAQEQSCTATFTAFDGEANSPVVLITLTAYNRAPRNAAATIPSVVGGYKRNQNLTCSGTAVDDDGNGLVFDYQWIKNENEINGATSATLIPAVAAHRPGDKIVCRIGVSDSHARIEASTAEVVMGNSQPTLSSFTIAEDGGSAPLNVGDRAVCSLSVTDADTDTVTTGAVSIESSADGATSWTAETLTGVDCAIVSKGRTCFSVGPVVRRKFLRCRVESFTDGFAPVLAPSFSASSVEVRNSTPVINAVTISPSSSFEVGSQLTCNADVTDADGDALQISPSFRWTRDGVAIESATLKPYTVTTLDRNSALRCEANLVVNSDGFSSTAVGPVKSVFRSYANSTPQILSVQVTPGSDARTGDMLACGISIFDPDGDAVNTEPPFGMYTWLANDGLSDVVLPGQSNKTLPVTQDLRKKLLKCSFTLMANSDARGSPAVAAVVSSNGVLVRNTIPTLTGVSMTAAATPVVTGTVLTCNRTVADADGDAFNDVPRFKWFADGATISGATQQTFGARARDREKKLTCAVELSANFDGQSSPVVGPVASDNFYTPKNSQPVVSGVQVTSTSLEPYYPGVSLSCEIGSIYDLDGDNLSPNYKWFNGAIELTGITTKDYNVGATDRGSNLKCAAVLGNNADGWDSFPQTIISANGGQIQNREPVKNFIPSLQPEGSSMIHRSAAVRCVIPNSVTQYDPDADEVTIRYVWKKGGLIFPGTLENGTVSDVLSLASDASSAPGQQLSCQVRLSDGLLTVTSLSSPLVTVLNRPPTIFSGSKTKILPAFLYSSNRADSKTLTCNGANFTDPDDDVLTVKYDFKRRAGSTESVYRADDPTTAAFTAVPPNSGWARSDEVWCEASATDPFGGSIVMSGASVIKTIVLNSVPKASAASCNSGVQTIRKFVNENFTTAACTSDFDDGDGDAPMFTLLADESDCPNINTKVFIDTSNGAISGIIPAKSCKITLALQDTNSAFAVNTNNQIVKTSLQFSPPFFATWGRTSFDNQCNVTFETKFTASSINFGSSTFSFSALVGTPQQHASPHTQNGLLSGAVNPLFGGGVVEASWTVSGTDAAFVQNLKKTVVIVDSPAVSGVPSQPVAMPGVQVTPAPDLSGGQRAAGCALADCVGSAGSISAGLTHSCAVANNGKLYCWGNNLYGELGNGSLQSPANSNPVEVQLPANHVARAVSASGYSALDASHTCAIIDENVGGLMQPRGVYCWGENQSGQLGRGAITSPRAPSQAVPQGVNSLSGGSGSEVLAVAVGGAHTCAVLKPTNTISGGAVRCWGANMRGQLGDGTLQNNPAPLGVIGFTSAGALGIAVGAEHSCVVTNVGSVQCWGNNDAFQLGVELGPNGEKYRAAPGTVPNLTGVVSISAGDKHTCVLLDTGAVKCWGSNSSGQLGDGNSGGYTEVPSPINGSVITTGERAIAISAGGNFSCALLESGGVKCWGANNQGQLGIGTTDPSTVPVDVQELSNQGLALEVGSGHTCILKNTGGVSCFGSLGPSGLSIPQKKPVNNVLPQLLVSPPVPAGQFKNCRVLRSVEQ